MSHIASVIDDVAASHPAIINTIGADGEVCEETRFWRERFRWLASLCIVITTRGLGFSCGRRCRRMKDTPALSQNAESLVTVGKQLLTTVVGNAEVVTGELATGLYLLGHGRGGGGGGGGGKRENPNQQHK